ncbi:MAG TPA: succinylglutamate desuccinylase/aspartoacylase family protein [Bacillota bacterium]|nr:succinylglutamate desuccinylase/aspartoacylase family protein [Bacillota bacterium]HOA15066.1 succinylglutamate desuccinylase/aspartoacylase family protein [Bacillota bacterium]HOG52885.1 succinylglutamate desuccinylase/aspartoacylase family protein [Bacillota bacterium]
MRKFRLIPALLLMALFASIAAAASPESMPGPLIHDERPGTGVSQMRWLSDYFKPIAGTPVDTKVYFMDSGKPGPTALVLGGTHGNEISGIMAATLIIERGTVTKGRLIVLPHANNAASANKDTRTPIEWIRLETPSGTRSFRYGARDTRADFQEPDPEKYSHYPTGQELPGNEARNLNRNYPGKADGTTTQKLAYAIMELIKAEDVTIGMDFHEADPGGRLEWMLVTNPKNIQIGAMAMVYMEMNTGFTLKTLEPSSDVRGLTHREWGDYFKDLNPYLIETGNPGMGSNSMTADVVNDASRPLGLRVAVALNTLLAVFEAERDLRGDAPALTGLPSFSQLSREGVGKFLR